MGGLSTRRGRFIRSSGKVVTDRDAGTGALEGRIDVSSIEFRHDEMNQHASSAETFRRRKCPGRDLHGRSHPPLTRKTTSVAPSWRGISTRRIYAGRLHPITNRG